MFLPVYKSGLFTLKFHLMEHRIEDISRFGNLLALEALSYKLYNTSFKAAYNPTSKRCAMHMDEIVFDLDQTKTNASWEMLSKKQISKSVCNEKVLRILKTRNYSIWSLWSVGFRDLRFDLSLEKNSCLDSGTVKRHFKLFSGHTVKVLVYLVTETMVQVSRQSVSHEAVHAVSHSGYLPGGIVPSLKTTANR